MKIAFSPCPNDTYLFHSFVKGQVGPPPKEVTLADIQKLNELALTGTYDLIKVSCALLPALTDSYSLLPIGAALGSGCGPLVIAKESFPLGELSQKCVAIPGKMTTAHLLLKRLAPTPRAKRFCSYDKIYELLDENQCEVGVIIHEGRFTYQDHGFVKIADLGELWESTYQMPIPLGCLVAKCGLEKELTEALQKSLALADQNPPIDYMQEHAQELDKKVLLQHVNLYINQETKALSPKGFEAISFLTEPL